jgi:hypothetical protein
MPAPDTERQSRAILDFLKKRGGWVATSEIVDALEDICSRRTTYRRVDDLVPTFLECKRGFPALYRIKDDAPPLEEAHRAKVPDTVMEKRVARIIEVAEYALR